MRKTMWPKEGEKIGQQQQAKIQEIPSQSTKSLTLRMVCQVKRGFEILGVWSTDTASHSFYGKG